MRLDFPENLSLEEASEYYHFALITLR